MYSVTVSVLLVHSILNYLRSQVCYKGVLKVILGGLPGGQGCLTCKTTVHCLGDECFIQITCRYGGPPSPPCPSEPSPAYLFIFLSDARAAGSANALTTPALRSAGFALQGWAMLRSASPARTTTLAAPAPFGSWSEADAPPLCAAADMSLRMCRLRRKMRERCASWLLHRMPCRRGSLREKVLPSCNGGGRV